MSAALANAFKTSIQFKSYGENEDYLAQGKPEPSIRWQTLILSSNNSRWWIKVTFRGEIGSTPDGTQNRRNDLQDFASIIDYSSLPLLDNTVTELILEEAPEKPGLQVILAINQFPSNPFVNRSGPE